MTIADTFTVHILNDADIATLVPCARTWFYDTYGPHNPPAIITGYMNTAFTPQQFQYEAQDENTLFIAVKALGEFAGYAKLVFGRRLDGVKHHNTVEIERLYAASKWHGKGVGQLLDTACKKAAKDRKCDSIWLGVWKKNARAVRFYEKCGFIVQGTKIFMMDDDPQEDWIMEKEL